MKQIAYVEYPLGDALKKLLQLQVPKKVLIVGGRESLERSGAEKICTELLREIPFTIFSDFSPNPKIEDIKEGIKTYKSFQPDLILAIGGGSAIDVAKVINILSAHAGEPEAYILGELPLEKKGAPLVAVPTTSGTGSEATHFAVVYIGNKKYSLAHEFILPDYAIVDPSLTLSMSTLLAAATGADAFSQAIESFWSTQSTEESKSYARDSLSLTLGNLVNSVVKGDLEARAAMSRAAYLAGRAINISKTTAAHALSYPVTSLFGVPHGQAVMLTLPHLLVYNDSVSEITVADSRGLDYVKNTLKELLNILGVEDASEGRVKLQEILKSIGLATRLSEVGVKKEDLTKIISLMSLERASNNPRTLTTQDALSFLESCL